MSRKMPVADVRLESHRHALLEDPRAGWHQVRDLLVPPCVYAVPGQRHVALEAGLVEAVAGEVDLHGLGHYAIRHIADYPTDCELHVYPPAGNPDSHDFPDWRNGQD